MLSGPLVYDCAAQPRCRESATPASRAACARDPRDDAGAEGGARSVNRVTDPVARAMWDTASARVSNERRRAGHVLPH
jgi:hypothetical protein